MNYREWVKQEAHFEQMAQESSDTKINNSQAHFWRPFQFWDLDEAAKTQGALRTNEAKPELSARRSDAIRRKKGNPSKTISTEGFIARVCPT
jgi:hypothetical protein